MPYIKVDVDRIRKYQQDVYNIRSRVSTISSSFSSIENRVDFDIKNSSGIRRKLENIESSLAGHKTVLQRTNTFLGNAAIKYFVADQRNGIVTRNDRGNYMNTVGVLSIPTEPQGEANNDAYDILKFAVEGLGLVNTGIDHISGLLESGKVAKEMSFLLKNGKIFLKGYNYGNWIVKGFKDNLSLKSLNVFDVIGLGLDAFDTGLDAGMALHSTWNDANKTTEKKIIDTVAIGGCSAASMAIRVGGKVLGKAVGGGVAAACCAIPVVGPVVGAVLGTAAGAVVDGAVGIIADTIASEAVVNRVSDGIENVVGTVKAGNKAVGDAAKKVLESKSAGEAIANTAKLVGTAVVAKTKVVTTAVSETVKTAVTVVKETAKNIGKAVKKIFKGW